MQPVALSVQRCNPPNMNWFGTWWPWTTSLSLCLLTDLSLVWLFSLVSLLVTQRSACCTGSLTPPGWHIHTRCYKKVCRVSRRMNTSRRELDRTVKGVSMQQLNWYRLLIIVRKNRRSPIKWPPLDYSWPCSWPNCQMVDNAHATACKTIPFLQGLPFTPKQVK